MKILLYGENWEGTHVNCISEVLRVKNIDFRIFDFFKIIFKDFGNRLVNKVARDLTYSQRERDVNKLFLREVGSYKPDIVFISKGVNLFPETLRKIQQSSIPIMNWNPDDFFNAANNSAHLLNSLELFDTVFSARSHLFEEYRMKGIRNPVYLDWYFIPSLHRSPDEQLPIEDKVTFIGTYSRRREKIIKSIKDRSIEIWGSGWERSSLRFQGNIKFKTVLSQSKFPEVISRSKINLNILTKENRDQTNLKIFEITASNGLLLSEFTKVSNKILTGGVDCLYYDFELEGDLNEKIEEIFTYDHEKWLQVRNEGFRKVKTGQHSIHDKVGTILNHIDQEYGIN